MESYGHGLPSIRLVNIENRIIKVLTYLLYILGMYLRHVGREAWYREYLKA